MNKEKNQISYKGVCENLVFPIILVLILAGYYAIYANRCYPVNEGWHITYAELFLNGKVPYKDFYYFMPPLDIFINAIWWKLSGGYFLIFRFYKMMVRLLLFVILYFELKRNVKPVYACIACIFGGFFISANLYDLLGDYNQAVELFCVLIAIGIRKIFEAKNANRTKTIFITGIIMGLGALEKQTLIFAAGIVMLLVLICYSKWTKQNFIKLFLWALSGVLLPWLVVLGYLFYNGAVGSMFTCFFGATAAKGNGILVIFSPFLNLITLYWNYIVYMLLCVIYLKIKNLPSVAKYNRVILGLGIVGWIVLFWNSIVTTSKLLFSSVYGIIFLVFIFGSILVFLFHSKEVTQKSSSDILLLIWSLISFFTIEFLLIKELDDFIYQLYKNVDIFRILAIISSVIFVLEVICLLSITLNKERMNKYSNWLPLIMAGVISGLSGLLAAQTEVPTRTLGISISILIAFLLNYGDRRIKAPQIRAAINSFVFIFMSCMCFFCMIQKISCAYSWWGSKELERSEETTPINVEGLNGFRVSESQAKLYEQLTKVINENTNNDSTVFGFPGVTIFNLLTNHMDLVNYAPVNFYDVCPDNVASADAERLNENNPDIVVWWDIPSCLEAHEAIFRAGNPSSQREIIYWFTDNIDNYQLVGQVSNVFVYKKIDGTPIGYTYIEDEERKNQTLITRNEDNSLFAGNGTLEDPYQISCVNDLINLQKAVDGAGVSFENRYFRQTSDIDMSEVDNWNPIGDVVGKIGFEGTYDGNGYVIENLTSLSLYASFMEYMNGTIINVTIKNAHYEGNYIGGIVSESSSGSIFNSYFEGEMYANGRAGGIADDFGNGKVINCLSNVTVLSAPRGYSIISYHAGEVSNCVSNNPTALYLPSSIGRIKENMVENDLDLIQKKLNNMEYMKFVDGYSALHWNVSDGAIFLERENE